MALNTTTIRMDEYTKTVIDHAAKYSNQTRTGFILSVCLEKAEQVLRERTSAMNEIVPMVFDDQDSRIFLEALEREFKPTQALLDLIKHADSLNIIDRT